MAGGTSGWTMLQHKARPRRVRAPRICTTFNAKAFSCIWATKARQFWADFWDFLETQGNTYYCLKPVSQESESIVAAGTSSMRRAVADAARETAVQLSTDLFVPAATYDSVSENMPNASIALHTHNTVLLADVLFHTTT